MPTKWRRAPSDGWMRGRRHRRFLPTTDVVIEEFVPFIYIWRSLVAPEEISRVATVSRSRRLPSDLVTAQGCSRVRPRRRPLSLRRQNPVRPA